MFDSLRPPWTVVHGILQARILDWIDFPSPGDLPNLGIESRSPALQADSLPVEPQGKSNAMVAIKCDYRCHSNKHGVPIKCPPTFHYYAPGLKGPQMGYMKGDCQWQMVDECMWIKITLYTNTVVSDITTGKTRERN